MKIRYEAAFAKDLKNIREKAVLKKLKKLIEDIKTAENVSQISTIKKLKGYKTYYRIRVSDYRVGFELVNNNEVIFARNLHRREVYKFFPD